MRSLVWRAAEKIRDAKIDEFNANRPRNDQYVIVKDTIVVGHTRLVSSTLNTFNKRFRAYQAARKGRAHPVSEELDEENDDSFEEGLAADFGESEDSDDLGLEDDVD